MIKKTIENLKENPIKRKRYIIGGILLLIFGFFLFSDHGILKRISLEAEKKSLVRKIELEYKNKDSINNIIKRLQSDTLEIERIAREKYGMLKPGEEAYHIKSETSK